MQTIVSDRITILPILNKSKKLILDTYLNNLLIAKNKISTQSIIDSSFQDLLFSNDKKLLNYYVNQCKANWMVVIKNTDYIYSLYNKENVFINSFDKAYAVNFKNRNDRIVKHLMITNYKI